MKIEQIVSCLGSIVFAGLGAFAQISPANVDVASPLDVDAYLLDTAEATVSRAVAIDGAGTFGATLVVVTPGPGLNIRIVHPNGAVSAIGSTQPGVTITAADLRSTGSQVMGSILPKGYWTTFSLNPPAVDGPYQLVIDRGTFSGQAGIILLKIAKFGIASRISMPPIAQSGSGIPIRIESFAGDTPVPTPTTQLTLVKRVSPAPVVFENLQLISTTPADPGFVTSTYSFKARRTVAGTETIDLKVDSVDPGVVINSASGFIVADEFNPSLVATLDLTVRRPSALNLTLAHLSIQSSFKQTLPSPTLQLQGTQWQGSIQGLAPGDYEIFGDAAGGAAQPFQRKVRTSFTVTPQYSNGVTWTEAPFDANANSLYDGIRFQFQMQVVQAGNYRFSLEVKSSNGGIAQPENRVALSPGQQTVQVNLGWRQIREQLGTNGPYTVSDVRVFFEKPNAEFDAVFNETPNRATGGYPLSQFENDDFRFLQTAVFSTVNDAGGLIQQLNVALGVTGPAANCTLGAGLYTPSGDLVADHRSRVTLVNGVTTPVASFPGEVIRRKNINGPYWIRNISLLCVDTQGFERSAEWKAGAVSGPYLATAFRGGSPTFNLRYQPATSTVASGGTASSSVFSDPADYFDATAIAAVTAPAGWQLTYRPGETFELIPNGFFNFSFSVPAGTRAGTYLINTRANGGGVVRHKALPVNVTGGPAGAASAVNVSAQVTATTSNIFFSRLTGLYNVTLTITNSGGQAIGGPITAGILNLPTGIALSNATGFFNGVPFIHVSNAGLSPGQSAAAALQFYLPSNSTPLSFGRAAYSGPFPPTALSLVCPAASATRNAAYSSSAQASGGITTYAFSVSQGALPTGLTLSSVTGAITGTPSQAQASAFTLTVTDAAQPTGQTTTAACSISVGP